MKFNSAHYILFSEPRGTLAFPGNKNMHGEQCSGKRELEVIHETQKTQRQKTDHVGYSVVHSLTLGNHACLLLYSRL